MFGSLSVVLYLHVWNKSKFSDNSNLVILVDIQRLQENSKWILCISHGAKWLSVRLLNKWLWNRFLLQLLKLDIQATTECAFIPKRVCYTFYSILLNYFIYSRVRASQILRGETTPVVLSKNWSKAISIHLIRKKFPVFQVIYSVIKKISKKIMLTWLTHNKYSTWLQKKYYCLQHLWTQV